MTFIWKTHRKFCWREEKKIFTQLSSRDVVNSSLFPEETLLDSKCAHFSSSCKHNWFHYLKITYLFLLALCEWERKIMIERLHVFNSWKSLISLVMFSKFEECVYIWNIERKLFVLRRKKKWKFYSPTLHSFYRNETHMRAVITTETKWRKWNEKISKFVSDCIELQNLNKIRQVHRVELIPTPPGVCWWKFKLPEFSLKNVGDIDS